MRTLSVVQLILLCVSISFGTSRENFIPLWQICLPSFVTQVALIYYSFFKFKTLRVVCMGFMGISLLCSVFLALVSFLRFSRFVFFPVKEDILFALECLARFPLEFLQLVVLALQFTEIRKLPEPATFLEHLYLDATFIFFVQDFVYGVFLAYYGELYWILGFTHFGVHVAQIALYKVDAYKLVIFMGLWGFLAVQHAWTLVLFYDDQFVRGFVGVYLLLLALYFTNAYMWFKDIGE